LKFIQKFRNYKFSYYSLYLFSLFPATLDKTQTNHEDKFHTSQKEYFVGAAFMAARVSLPKGRPQGAPLRVNPNTTFQNQLFHRYAHIFGGAGENFHRAVNVNRV